MKAAKKNAPAPAAEAPKAEEVEDVTEYDVEPVETKED